MNSHSDNKQPWYHEGLQFTCSGCGDCCTGAPGFVWLNEAETEALAERMDLSVAEFCAQYTRKVGTRRSLNEFQNGDCVFFDSKERNCTVYELRPRQCRTWPFWESNLKSPETWAKTCEACPGSGRGQLYQLDEIEIRRRTMNV